jgi:hypothetical protein
MGAEALSQSIVFSAAGRDFTIDDVLLAARARGDLVRIEAETAEALACTRYAEEEGFELDEDAAQAASVEFRYQRDLATAEDTERWLQRRGLTLDDFGAYFERRQCRLRFHDQASELACEFPPSPEELEAALWPDVLLGNHFEALGRALAWSVAARLEQEPARVVWPALDEDLPLLERSYQEERRRTLTPENCACALKTRHQSLIRVVLERASFASREIAEEALLCVREDGEPLQEVAAGTAGRFAVITSFAESLPESLQQRCLSALPGEVFPPMQDDDGHAVVRLVEKIEPGLDDADVRDRVEQWLLDARFAQLVRTHIRWADKELE